ncbi:retrovirus-related Pol polyprotein from transposon 297 [Trichonephila clavipes]|nr:retrovirus-related Pol polyprotein from transposon 297 [Trichonephila clavipes]
MSPLDLKSGYFQLAISPKDIENTAFITRNGTFAFLRMPFGVSGAAPNFQKAIDIILKPVIGHFVSVYMDDVIITSPSFNEHLDHLNQIFTLLRDAGLTLNKNKCHFARDKLKYFGLVISKERIETDHSKVKAITEMKPPKNSKEVSKCLGMAGWYQKFIPQYADICEPLYRLKKKGAKFNWNPVGNMDGSQISCAALRTLALNSREQLIREQREDPELGHIYRYSENPDDGSVNATICEEDLFPVLGEFVGGGWRPATRLSRASQMCSIGFMSGEHAGHSIRTIPFSKRESSTKLARCGLLFRPLK